MILFKSNQITRALVLFLLVSLSSFANSGASFVVGAANTLDKIAGDIALIASSGNDTVKFSSYVNLGKFHLENSTADTLLFQRSSDTDAVLDVTGILFEIHQVKSTIIFKNLAFRITDPLGILISGADDGRQNGNLIIDSCFIFSDQLNSRFLSWIGDLNSGITIRHSFLVTKTGTDTLSLKAGKVEMSNNNVNFAGLINTTTNQNLTLINNTFNRAQINANGDLTSSTHQIANNIFAFHSKHNALVIGGEINYYPIRLQDFMDPNPIAPIGNKRFESWADFDPPPKTQFSEHSNVLMDSVVGRDSSELWNWYLPMEKSAGYPNGNNKSPVPFNVFPNQTLFTADIAPISGAKFYFRPSLIPKRADVTYQAGLLLNDSAGASLRFVWPGQGGIKIGTKTTFTLDSLILPAVTTYSGQPVLTAWQDGKYQEPDTIPGVPSNRFVNKYPSAQIFHPAFYGNTCRGSGIVPRLEEIRNHIDTIRFDKVDSAGQTWIVVPASLPTFKKQIRYLDRNLSVLTTAKITSGSVLLGAIDATLPYKPDSLYWWLSGQDIYIKPASLNKMESFATSPLPKLDAYLVEVLSVPRGVQDLTLKEAVVHTKSALGFQINIDDSTYVPDSTRYGNGSRGYKVNWAGRADSDTVLLTIKWKPDQEAFRDSMGKVIPMAWTLEQASGNARLVLTKADSGKTYFLASKFNVIADTSYNDDSSFGAGVTVRNFKSATPATVSFQVADPSVLVSVPPPNDTVFRNTTFRAGKILKSSELQLVQNWDMLFNLTSIGDRSKIEVYWTDGKSNWTRMVQPVPSFVSAGLDNYWIKELPPQARSVVAIERLLAPESYIRAADSVKADSLFIRVTYKNDSNKTINAYCLQLIGVNAFGEKITSKCDTVDIGIASQVRLQPNQVYVYGIQYFQGSEKYGNPSFQPVKGSTWPATVLRDSIALQRKSYWHVVGFPYKGTFQKALLKQKANDDSISLDTTYRVGIKMVGAKPTFDTIQPADFPIKAGDAFMMASSRQYLLQKGADTAFLPLKAFTLNLTAGWHFIGNPFPATLQLWKIRSTKASTLKFWELDTLIHSAADSIRQYEWPAAKVLKAYQGYAYFASENEQLTFDLFADSVSAPLALKSSEAGRPALMQVRLDASWSSSLMELTAINGDGNIPFLPAPASRLEMRVGGQSGYMLKAIHDFASIDEPIEIKSSQKGSAKFSLVFPGTSDSKAIVQMRLIDLASGRIYDEASAAELPVERGSHAYRLVAGTAAFVEDKTNSFLAGAPREIGLSQNFPNPVRGLTRINLDWPATQNQDRHAVLQVLDTRGREIRRIDMDRIQVGRQVLSIDVSSWSPGVYFYRLTVISGGERNRLQKRMLVTP